MSVMQVTDMIAMSGYLYIPSKKARDLTFRRHPGSVSGVTVRLPLSWSTVHPLFLLFWIDSFILKKIACKYKFWGVFKWFAENKQRVYSRLSLNGHLYKTDTSVKRTLRVDPCLSLRLLFDSPYDRHLSKTDT